MNYEITSIYTCCNLNITSLFKGGEASNEFRWFTMAEIEI